LNEIEYLLLLEGPGEGGIDRYGIKLSIRVAGLDLNDRFGSLQQTPENSK